MNKPASNIDFETLLSHIEKLSEAEKNKLLSILLENQLPLVNEQVPVYAKALEKPTEFDKKWENSLTAEQFKTAIFKHIDSLPWK
ncbi:hypothetical protein [Pedobacter aquatilis]|uniref:hypothetical protein n=1 Tax=Pedobacter aquatilis TaxID=351343 RepID=UPI002931CCC9|nr:hypothetical protein [Pedobacter aquatilis]